MTEKTVFDYLLNQGPVIFFMALVNYWQYKYFTKTLDNKDVIIAGLRNELISMHKDQLQMMKEHLEAQNKSNSVLESLKEVLKELKENR